MASESGARKTMREKLQSLPGMHWARIEGALTPGIPDVNLCFRGDEAWIEVKEVERFPVRSSTLLKVGLRPEQRIWLEERKAAHGRAYVLAKIGREWFMWEDHFRELLLGARQDQLRSWACWAWENEFHVESFLVVTFGKKIWP